MAYTPARDRGASSNFGGGSVIIHEVNDDLTELTATAGYYDMGYYRDSEFRDSTPRSPIIDESGAQYKSELGARDTSFVITVDQRANANLNLAQTARDSYFIVKKDEGIVNNKYFERFIFGQFDPDTIVALPGGTWKATFRGLRNESAYTLSTTVLAGTGTAGFASHATVTVTLPAYTADGSSGIYVVAETPKT